MEQHRCALTPADCRDEEIMGNTKNLSHHSMRQNSLSALHWAAHTRSIHLLTALRFSTLRNRISSSSDDSTLTIHNILCQNKFQVKFVLRQSLAMIEVGLHFLIISAFHLFIPLHSRLRSDRIFPTIKRCSPQSVFRIVAGFLCAKS